MRKQAKIEKKRKRIEEGKETKKQEKKRLLREKKNKHHRLAKSQGGTSAAGNISVVKIQKHRAYHALFEAKVPEGVAAILTETWLPLSSVALTVPTNRVSEALDLLFEAGIVGSNDPFDYGVTDEHLKHHGNVLEKATYALPPLTKGKRPDP